MVASLVVGIGGTVRTNSSGEKMVAAVLDGCARRGPSTRLFGSELMARQVFRFARMDKAHG